MTDLEISKALALAIGWSKTIPNGNKNVWVLDHQGTYRIFDYRDWNVIGPIAARHDCFPVVSSYLAGQWVTCTDEISVHADTPQKAIALAVIGVKQ